MSAKKTKPLALILAGGKSSRLEPYAYLNQHKAMLSLLGRPILAYVIAELKKAGLKDLVIVVNSANTDIESYFQNGAAWGVNIKYVIQKEPLGMGKAVLAAQTHLTRPFFVLNPNHINAAPFLSSMMEAGQPPFEGVLLGREDQTPWRYGVLKLKKDQIIGIVEKPAPGTEPSKTRLVGMYLLSPTFVEILRGTSLAEDQFERALAQYVKKARIRLMLTEQPTYSIKHPWDLFTLAAALFSKAPQISPKSHIHKTAHLEGAVTVEEGAQIHAFAVIKGPAYIGKNAVVGSHALVRDGAVLEAGAMVGAHAEVARSIIMENSHMHSGYIGDSIIGRNTSIGAGFITANRRLDRGEISINNKSEKVKTGRTRFGVLMGHDVKVGIHAGTMPGVVVGSGATIGPGTIVFEDVSAKAKRAVKFEYV